MRGRYPASPIPDGQDMAENYHHAMIATAHTAQELADVGAWMNGQTMIVDDQGQTVISARDYEHWVDRRRSSR